MRYLTLVFLMAVLLLPFTTLKAQQDTNREEISYEGGVSRLNKELSLHLSSALENISRNHLLFFEVLLNREKGIKSVTTLNKEQDATTKAVLKAIEKTSKGWSNHSNQDCKVIIPVFLIKDAESGLIDKNNYTNTLNDFEQSKQFTKCFFQRPSNILCK